MLTIIKEMFEKICLKISSVFAKTLSGPFQCPENLLLKTTYIIRM